MEMVAMMLAAAVAVAGTVTVPATEGSRFRRLFDVCDSHVKGCAGGGCKLKVTSLTCERRVGGEKAKCTYVCEGTEHMLTDEQAMEVFKAAGKPGDLTREKDGLQSIRDVNVDCGPASEKTVCVLKGNKKR